MTISHNLPLQIFLGIFSLMIVLSSCSDKNEKSPKKVSNKLSLFSTLHDIEDLSITIETDIQSILNNKDSLENIYQDADLTSYSGGQPSLSTKIEIRPRGVTRKSLCDFPPVMIKITKKERKKLNVKKTDNIKLVTCCKEDSEYQNLVHKELLCYKLYNVLTDTSYRVKMTKVTFIDTKGTYPNKDSHTFMIEPTDEMSDRLSCFYMEVENSPVKLIHKEQYKNFVLFQYMTGNTDWNLSGRHNIRMLDCDSKKGPKPVPYDFDYSGLVNAEYAKPHPMHPIKEVTERLFMFKGPIDEDFSTNYALFNAKRPAFYAVINDFPYLNEKVKNEMTSYIDQFYENIASPEIMRAEWKKTRRK